MVLRAGRSGLPVAIERAVHMGDEGQVALCQGSRVNNVQHKDVLAERGWSRFVGDGSHNDNVTVAHIRDANDSTGFCQMRGNGCGCPWGVPHQSFSCNEPFHGLQ